MAKLKAALDPLSAPRSAADGENDERTSGQRPADGAADLVELALRGDNLPPPGPRDVERGVLEQLVRHCQGNHPVPANMSFLPRAVQRHAGQAGTHLHGERDRPRPRKRGNRAHLLLAISEENLRTGRGFGVTTTGVELTAAAIKRIACNARIIPLRIDGHGAGRRPHPPHRHPRPVAGPGATRPGLHLPRLRPPTHPVRSAPPHPLGTRRPHRPRQPALCGYHHDVVHHVGWDVQFGADGHPQVIPPDWIDATRTPRRNSYGRPPPLDPLP